MPKRSHFEDVLKTKLLQEFHECEDLKRKRIEELACPNCGFVDQEPEYQSICSNCGHLQ